MMEYQDSSPSEKVKDKSLVFISDEEMNSLGSLQIIHSWLVELIYKERKYNRHAPHLGYPVWFGRAMRDLEKTEEAIDKLQNIITEHISIQYN